MEYLDRQHQMGYQLEDVSLFIQIVTKERPTSHEERSDDRQMAQKRHGRERKGSGPHSLKHANEALQSFTPPGSEHSKAYKNIAQTLINGGKRLDQCSRCGNIGLLWCKCHAANPVVPSAKSSCKRTRNQAGHHEQPPVPKARRLKACPSSCKKAWCRSTWIRSTNIGLQYGYLRLVSLSFLRQLKETNH